MKRFLSMLLATLVAFAGLIVMAPAASAHHTTISVAGVECVANGKYKITWRVQNWNGGRGNTATVTNSSRGVVPVGTTFANNEAKTFSETVTGKQSLTLQVSARWQNGSTSTNTGSITQARYPDCAEEVTPQAPSVTDPTCEADGTLIVPADTDKVTYSQSPSGTGPGTYEVTATAKPGYTIVGPSSWTLTVKPKKSGDDCLVDVVPPAPSVTDPTCEADGELVLPDTEGVKYKVSPSYDGPGTYEVKAIAEPGHRIKPGATKKWTLTVEPKKSGDDCLVEVEPVAPKVTPITACDSYGSIVFAETEGVVYMLVSGDGRSGAYTVVASAAEGYKLKPGSQTEFTGDLGEYTECVTPAEPTVTAPSCEAGGELVLPEDPRVEYTVEDLGDGKVTVTATAEPGYTLVGPAQWTIEIPAKLTGPECDTLVTPVAPDVTPITACGELGSLTFAVTEGVEYELVEGDGESGPYTVVATPKPGFKFAEDAVTEFTGDLGEYTDCATPVAPEAVEAECETPGSLTLPTTEGVVYELVDGDGLTGPYTVVATPAEGYAFEEGVQTVFTGDLGQLADCEVSGVDVIDESDDGAANAAGPLPKTGAPEGLRLLLLAAGLLLAVGAALIARQSGPFSAKAAVAAGHATVPTSRRADRNAPSAARRGSGPDTPSSADASSVHDSRRGPRTG